MNPEDSPVPTLPTVDELTAFNHAMIRFLMAEKDRQDRLTASCTPTVPGVFIRVQFVPGPNFKPSEMIVSHS